MACQVAGKLAIQWTNAIETKTEIAARCEIQKISFFSTLALRVVGDHER